MEKKFSPSSLIVFLKIFLSLFHLQIFDFDSRFLGNEVNKSGLRDEEEKLDNRFANSSIRINLHSSNVSRTIIRKRNNIIGFTRQIKHEFSKSKTTSPTHITQLTI